MKKKVTKEVTVCDACGEETYSEPCLRCGAEYCYSCRETHGLLYQHSADVRGRGDGYYCHPCDQALQCAGTDALHNAYTAIRALRIEHEAFYAAWKDRVAVAEAALARVQGTIQFRRKYPGYGVTMAEAALARVQGRRV